MKGNSWKIVGRASGEPFTKTDDIISDSGRTTGGMGLAPQSSSIGKNKSGSPRKEFGRMTSCLKMKKRRNKNRTSKKNDTNKS